MESAREVANYQRDLNAKQVAEIIAGVKEAGMEVIEEIDTAPFKQIVEGPLRKTFAEKYGTELLERDRRREVEASAGRSRYLRPRQGAKQ